MEEIRSRYDLFLRLDKSVRAEVDSATGRNMSDDDWDALIEIIEHYIWATLTPPIGVLQKATDGKKIAVIKKAIKVLEEMEELDPDLACQWFPKLRESIFYMKASANPEAHPRKPRHDVIDQLCIWFQGQGREVIGNLGGNPSGSKNMQLQMKAICDEASRYIRDSVEASENVKRQARADLNLSLPSFVKRVRDAISARRKPK